ncbi:MAG: alpha-N-arabinofuranosidase [Bacteroidota bacterium]|nr:alpha-N-arabinofuranosidase [Bacteroidota bacterium]MDP4205593.1 alpha-N-arabinofuranosidase [Bacteroidota bacterium]
MAGAQKKQDSSGLKAHLTINADQGQYQISKNIYGQFSEHLGNCIYGGIWVGENSPIPNTNGYRNDVLQALKKIHVPILRWPGGCFADEYHWMDGIGPRDKRPKMVNTNWGGVVEDNSFGTHEFLNFCELIGAEPYLSGNVGSGTVEELAKWVEYINSDGDSPMANLRRKNGREKPWGVKYLGVGNESWGCGGNMAPEYYADLFRRYSTYCRNYGDHGLFRIASGASDYDYNWTDVLMKKVGNRMNAISLHYYTCKGWSGSKGSATKFTNDEYLWTMSKCMEIEDVVKKHMAIMDKYDPRKEIGLLVDEWGTWWDVEPGTNPGFLYQQNTLRDAFVAGITLNIFNSHCDRIKMANIAQVVNVLQSIILTKNEKMVLTPTYHVFDLYQVHQDATLLPSKLEAPVLKAEEKDIPELSASASKDKNGAIHISLVNIDPTNPVELTCDLQGKKATTVTGKIITASGLSVYNTFENPNAIQPAEFKGAKIGKEGLIVKLPAKSIVVLEIK